EDPAVDLEQLGRHRPHRRRGGHGEALVHPLGDHPGDPAKRRGVLRGGVGLSGGRRRLGRRGRRAVSRLGRGGRRTRLVSLRRAGGCLVAVGAATVLEEAAPLLADRLRRIEVALVHLLDQPVVASGSGGLEHRDTPECRKGGFLTDGDSQPARVPVTQSAYRAAYTPPRWTNSAWGPRSTSLPASKTSTSSAASAVARRCAIVTEVRPAVSRSIARRSWTSRAGSTAEVASSRTNRSGAEIHALTRATSWRSPADRLPPRSPTSVAISAGRLCNQPSRPSSMKAVRISRSVACGDP